MPQTSALARVTFLIVLGLTTSGCELIGGIFKAGVWIGALGVVAIAVLLVVAAKKLRR
jgi:hypothetical protein